MKIKKETIIGLAVIIAIVALAIGFNMYRKYSVRAGLAARIAQLSPRGGPPGTIEDLREAITLYEAQIEQYVRDAAQTGVYWKILATRLQDKGLHTEALNALERAIAYTPEDATLHYLRGISAGIVAKSYYDAPLAGDAMSQRKRYFALTEGAYLRAIELDRDYGRPRLGLGILYVFELDRPAEAIPQLEQYLEMVKDNVDGMFVLARAYYMTDQYQRALELYDRIPSLTKDPQKQADAEQNRQTILGLLNE